MDHEHFDWDSGNIDHLTDAEPEQVEEAVLDPHAVYFSAYNRGTEERRALVGQTEDGTLLFVVYTHRGGKVRVITARFPALAEQRRYPRRGEVAMVETARNEQLQIVYSLSDIPDFESERAEAEFWQTHRLSDELLDQLETPRDPALPSARTKPVSFRLDENTLARAKALANARGIGYQTMLKNFIMERLYEEEHRSGIFRQRFRFSRPRD